MSSIRLKLKRSSDGGWEVKENSNIIKKKNLIEIKTWKNKGYIDILHVLKKYRNRVKTKLNSFLQNNQAVKFYLTLKVIMKKTDFKTGDDHFQVVHFHSKTKILLSAADYEDIYDECSSKIWEGFDIWLAQGSGFRLHKIENLQLSIFQYNPISGRSYIKTPRCIVGKRSVRNLVNSDNMCFIWAVLSAVYRNHFQESKGVKPYIKYLNTLKFDYNEMPMSVENISKFEKENRLPISVYSIHVNEKKINPLRITKERYAPPINLLLIISGRRKHYTWISNFNR